MNRIYKCLMLCTLFSIFLAYAPIARGSTETLIYSFCENKRKHCPDGAMPRGTLLNLNGTLYGTTDFGGFGSGTVFSINLATNSENVIHSFGRNTDGYRPFAGLIEVKGVLYGTTTDGGQSGYGTVFSVTLGSHKETILHSFLNNSVDGGYPEAPLLYNKGILYGTTSVGGGSTCLNLNCGTVFSLTRKGDENVVYSFGGQNVGGDPVTGLIEAGGLLYGTTTFGGNADCDEGDGCGIVFSFDPVAATETLLYSFQDNGTDGDNPSSSVLKFGGALYGTTQVGGTHGQGTIFKIDPVSGSEQIVYNFKGGGDSSGPAGGLIEVGGTLYGVTDGGDDGYGTVFSFNPTSGAEIVLHTFKRGHKDGYYPSGLVFVNGALYGATYQGGLYGEGAVYVVQP